MKPASIRGRLLLASGVLTLLALGLSWFVLSALLEGFVTRRLTAELVADARGIMAAADWDQRGGFSVAPPPADPRFEQPLAGFYWQVADGSAVLARAPALLTGDLGRDGAAPLGPGGAALMAHREAFTAPGDGRPLFVTVTLPAAERDRELASVRGPLGWSLAVLGLALVVAQLLAVRTGLVELSRFVRAVARIRGGEAERLPPPRAAELMPLAAELDHLLATNAATLERTRAQAGDLAHALKTPLAVLANRAQPEDALLIARMEQMIQWHLKRSRAAGAGLVQQGPTPVGPVLDDIALVLTPEARRRGVELAIRVEGNPAFRGDAEDLAEMIGNLAENAVKWAEASVEIAARQAGGVLVVEVCDDGPGIPEADRAELLRRGVRLDEAKPGHGLGLAIVADRASLYGGDIMLTAAPSGGLCARLVLPVAGEARMSRMQGAHQGAVSQGIGSSTGKGR